MLAIFEEPAKIPLVVQCHEFANLLLVRGYGKEQTTEQVQESHFFPSSKAFGRPL